MFFSSPRRGVSARVKPQVGEHRKRLKMKVRKFNLSKNIHGNQEQRRGTDMKYTREQQSLPKALRPYRGKKAWEKNSVGENSRPVLNRASSRSCMDVPQTAAKTRIYDIYAYRRCWGGNCDSMKPMNPQFSKLGILFFCPSCWLPSRQPWAPSVILSLLTLTFL